MRSHRLCASVSHWPPKAGRVLGQTAEVAFERTIEQWEQSHNTNILARHKQDYTLATRSRQTRSLCSGVYYGTNRIERWHAAQAAKPSVSKA